MTVWSTEVEARVQVSEELKGALMLALAAAFAEPKPALALGSGRLIVRLEVEADQESEAARLGAERFASAWEKAIQELLPRLRQLDSRHRRRRKSGSSERSYTGGPASGALLPTDSRECDARRPGRRPDVVDKGRCR